MNACPDRLFEFNQERPNAARCFSALRPERARAVHPSLWHCVKLRAPLLGAPPMVLPQHLMIDPATAALIAGQAFVPQADARGRVIGLHVRDREFRDVVELPAWLF